MISIAKCRFKPCQLRKREHAKHSLLLVGLVAMCLLLSASNAFAATHYVPDNFPTIQQALTAANEGDTIIVRDGTYTGPGNKNLDFLGKAITLSSQNGPEHCFIDCEGEGRGFDFHSGETTDAILSGLTITNGSVAEYENGGAISCSNASTPTFMNCIISNSSAYRGGGIYSERDSSPTLTHCIIKNNSADYRGGGICSYGPMEIVDCDIIGNTSADDAAGLYCSGQLAMTDCVVSDNFADQERGTAGGIYLSTRSGSHITNSIIARNSSARGGGIYFSVGYGASLRITDCAIEENSAGNKGGGCYLSQGWAEFADCVITGNLAGEGGGGIYSSYWTSPTIFNCLVTHNSAGSGGGFFFDRSTPAIKQSTFSGNSADSGGALFAENESFLNVYNCIFSGDNAGQGSKISLLEESDLLISHSSIQGGMDATYISASRLDEGEGNIAADPLFVAGPLGGYYLNRGLAGNRVNSPCVDAGWNSAAYFGLNSYTTRNDQRGDVGRVDMGYHYPMVEITPLTRMNLISPANASQRLSPPRFSWTTDGGAKNAYVVDMSLSLRGPFYTSLVIEGETHWTMPDSWWDRIPSGSFVFWRVRGADQGAKPLNIIYSNELWWFYKP
jgi:predicted outer membrane repeat protein